MSQLNKLSKLLPSTIGKSGQLTIMKRKNKAFYCFYPSPPGELPIVKDKSLSRVIVGMHKALVERGVISKPTKKKKKISVERPEGYVPKKRAPKTLRNIKLKAQKRALDKK